MVIMMKKILVQLTSTSLLWKLGLVCHLLLISPLTPLSSLLILVSRLNTPSSSTPAIPVTLLPVIWSNSLHLLHMRTTEDSRHAPPCSVSRKEFSLVTHLPSRILLVKV